MSTPRLTEFQEERSRLNDLLLRYADTTMKRFLNLDTMAYQDGALPARVKEMLGLTASLVMRCDDCISYHLIKCAEHGLRDEELREVLDIALVVGGSITIPHIRRAIQSWDEWRRAGKIPESTEPNTVTTSPTLEPDSNIRHRRLLADLDGRIARILIASEPITARLQQICDLLRQSVPHYHWVGFYLVDPLSPQELVLGPFSGASTEHVRIRFGQGICGQAAAKRATVIVPDVGKEDNYLSCDIKVRSEIVLPLFSTDGVLVGELDLDSHNIDAFGEDDHAFLQGVCVTIGRELALGAAVVTP